MKLTRLSIPLCCALLSACERPPSAFLPDDLTRPVKVQDRPIVTNRDLASALADERTGRLANAAKLCGVREAVGQSTTIEGCLQGPR